MSRMWRVLVACRSGGQHRLPEVFGGNSDVAAAADQYPLVVFELLPACASVAVVGVGLWSCPVVCGRGCAMVEPPSIRDWEPVERYRGRRPARRAAVTAGDAFRLGFFGGLGLWCAAVFIQLCLVALGVVVIVAAGGLGAIVQALQ